MPDSANVSEVDPSDDPDEQVEEEYDYDQNLEPTDRVEAYYNADEGVEVDEILDVSQLPLETETFGELRLPEPAIVKLQAGLKALIETLGSVEATGDAVYSALFEAAPSLQHLYKTPRAVQGMKFAMSIALIISKLRQPEELKVIIDQLAFQHITTDVTIPRIEVFRDALLELFASELGEEVFTPDIRVNLARVFHYMGGAFIYVRNNYWGRLQLISQCWTLANKHDGAQEAEESCREAEGLESPKKRKDSESPKKSGRTFLSWKKDPAEEQHTSQELSMATMEEGRESNPRSKLHKNKVPTTFPEMFKFNAQVMGYGNSAWMEPILDVFDAMVTNVANPPRVIEEADVLSIVLSKVTGKIEFLEFKAVMLASLRSLLPKTWNSECEVAWTWLWEVSFERMLKANMGKPHIQQKALKKLYCSMTEEQLLELRTGIYTTFFSKCAQGQDYFKQSSTRLHFIADRVIMFTQEIYKDPKGVMQDLSALGLRHVGYGIPTELFGPFVSAAIEKIRELTKVPEQEEAFRWSLGLISRVLVRTITEGSTLVMRAINANSAKDLRKAVSNAPRALRAEWMLKIQVGTQSISPLLWSIQSGSLEAAEAILHDLLTIRADRDQYYYAMDALFNRHTDIVKRICQDGPELLPTLFNGLIWRSRVTEHGRMVQEAVQYVTALAFVVTSFGCALASSDVMNDHFSSILPALTNLCRIMLGMYSGEEYQELAHEPKLMFTLSIFVICTTIFLFNLLIAQLNCAYMGIFKDMLGYARLNRGAVILENVSRASPSRWSHFVAGLRMDEKLEFNEGDIGLAGGIQVLEPASANPVTTDSIKRYGGSTSPSAQWPDSVNDHEAVDKFEKLEKFIDKAVRKIARAGKGGSTTGGSSMSMSSSSASSMSEGDEH